MWKGDKAAEEGDVPWVASLRLSSADNMESNNGHILSTLSREDIKAAQSEDPVIREVITKGT